MPTVKPKAIELTKEQTDAINFLLKFRRPEQTLGGYAGTGKTTVIKTLKAELPGFKVCAFTGKAANVLRRKGIAASTIHSLIYHAVEIERKLENGRIVKDTEFVLREPHEMEADGFIVDEASMVSRQLYDDLRAYELPIIFVGDHGQLEPVGDNTFNLMTRPDVTLEKIHRNAGEIAQFAAFVRQGNAPIDWKRQKLCSGKQVLISEFKDLARKHRFGLKHDQIICGLNQTRVAWNERVRELRGYPDDERVIGDRVMCLRNDNRLGVFNGMQGEISELLGDVILFTSDGKDYRVEVDPDQFNNPHAPKWTKSRALPFDYCYCVTCHKAQGDEWDDVLVLEEYCHGWDQVRWAYTAASRARKFLTWIP